PYGNNSIDIFGIYKKHALLVQCKKSTAKVGKSDIRIFEGVLSRYNKNETLGVLVVSGRNDYTTPALLYAKDSPHKLLLTNIDYLQHDLSNYSLERPIDNILLKIKQKKREDELYMRISELKKEAKMSPDGDSGMDIFGSYKKHSLLVLCKDYVGINEIKEFEGTLSRYNRSEVFGVFVVSRKDGYTNAALLYAKSSPYKLLLTDIHDLKHDLENYPLEKPISDISQLLQNQNRKNKKMIN
ncbi:12147_t:CDS:2, partial [Acaulospora morrowiae]